MYEKIKDFFKRYWFFFVAVFGLGFFTFLGFRCIRDNLDINIKNNKITITKMKN